MCVTVIQVRMPYHCE